MEARPDPVDGTELLDPANRPETPSKTSVPWAAMSDIPDDLFRSSSPLRTSKQKNGFVRRMSHAGFNRAEDGDVDTAEETAGERWAESSDLDLCPSASEQSHERIGLAAETRPLPSPPPEKNKPLNIARKPLPAVPRDGL